MDQECEMEHACDCEDEFVQIDLGGPIEDVKDPEMREMAEEASREVYGG